MASAQAPDPSWQCDKSLVECLDHLFTSSMACDVTFLVGEAKHRISAHRTILISRSPVFYVMFEGNLSEKGEILIPDIEQEVFTMFLRYLYTDTIELTVNTATSVLSAARKYMVDRLVQKCQTFLKSSLTTENVCLLLEKAHFYTEESVREDCVNVIAKSPGEVLKTTGFVDLCDACVKSITESDDFAVEESVVYEAVIRWSEAECGRQGLEVTDTNRREVLGDIIYTVRFPIMDPTYLLQHVITRDILTSEQLVSVLRFQQDNKAYPCTEFSVNKRKARKPVHGVFECISRFTKTINNNLRNTMGLNNSRCNRTNNNQWNTLGSDDSDSDSDSDDSDSDDSDSISFVSTADMFLHGLQLYGSSGRDQSVLIGVYSQDGSTLYKDKHVVSANQTLCNTEFHYIIKITRGHTYTVVLHEGVQTDVLGTNGCSTVKCGDAQIRFMPSTSFLRQNTTVDRGRIPGLLVSFQVLRQPSTFKSRKAKRKKERQDQRTRNSNKD